MAKLERSQIYPPTTAITDPAVKVWADDLLKFLDDIIGRIAAIPFNRSENVSVADTGNADTEFAVSHHLTRIPSGFIVAKSNKSGVVYDSGTAWTTTAIYLKCSAANAAVELCVF